MALEFIGGTLFTLLYDGVKQAMSKNAKLKFLLGDLKSTLDSLVPRDIQQIGDHNVELGLPNEEIESLKMQMEEGVKLVRKFSKFRMWNYYCCLNDYTDQIVELDRSLKRLLEKLKLQEVRDVKELLILARTIKDKQDELERKMGDILKMQQETRDAMQSFVPGGSNTEMVPRQIEGNGVGQVASVEGRAALGAVFGMLFDAVIGVKDKTVMFKPLLGDLKSTLDSLKPMIEEIVEHNKVLNRPKEELEHFRIQMEKGVELVQKCSKVYLWASYQQYKYTDKLLGLDKSLQRLLNTLKSQVARDVRETLVSIRNIEAMIKQIEESGLLQNQIQTIGWCAAPESSSMVTESSSPVTESSSPTVGLDVLNVQGTRDVQVLKETLVSVKNTKAGVNQTEGTGVAQNQTEKEGTSRNHSRNTVSNTSSSSTARRSLFLEAANPIMDKLQITGKSLEKSNLRVFSFAELKVITRNFRRDAVLGEGGFGKVFKGWVDKKTLAPSKPPKGIAVAIKKLNPESAQGFSEWRSEVLFLGKLSHPNLIKLLGYCCEKEELLLVYEFMPRGSLRNHLFRRSDDIESLSWDSRLKIAIGAARGLAFLHTSEEQVIHRDIKASNILLDGNFNAKISGFGFAKLGPADGESHVSTRIMGTYGYLDPEYVATGHLCVKSDVYSFGVMLLEILTGLRVFDVKLSTEQLDLVGWAKPLLCYEKNLKTIMDVRMEGQYSYQAALQTADVILKCLAPDCKSRPSMEEVVELLEQVRTIRETCTK